MSLCCSGLVVGLGIAVANHSGWGWLSVDLFLVVFFFGGVGLPLRMWLALRFWFTVVIIK